MATFTATLEQAEDGSWTALAVVGNHSILGDGETREAALESLREGLRGEIAYLKSRGETLPISTVETIRIEVAA